jgi:excinuclease ABC subunit A
MKWHILVARLMCPASGISYPEPEPSLFSFNSPYGACPSCNGLGEVSEVDLDKIIPDKILSVKKGGIVPIGEYKRTWIFDKIESYLVQEGYTLSTPIKDLSDEVIHILLYGNEGLERSPKDKSIVFEGIISFISRHSDESSAAIQRWAQSFMNRVICPECQGTRLKKEAHFFKIGDKHIGDVAQFDIKDLNTWFASVETYLEGQELVIGTEIIKEIRTRINFILDVGLEYLTLHRSARSLSGGEAQRIRLATQIGSELMNVLYVLDEPSIGLHQRDNSRSNQFA